MKNTNTETLIGTIDACIAGDYRYSTVLVVYKTETCVQVRLQATGAVGGMDGGGDVYRLPEKVVQTWSAVTAAELVRGLKKLFKSVDGGTIAHYGKPTLNFRWYVNGDVVRGLNAKLAALALGAA